jgi:C-terminal processing protease CtpA/Prc
VDGSPAYEAGVRNGDVLVDLDDHSGPDSKTISGPIDPFWQRPGTKLDFTLKRGKSTIKATALLRDILAPEHTKP